MDNAGSDGDRRGAGRSSAFCRVASDEPLVGHLAAVGNARGQRVGGVPAGHSCNVVPQSHGFISGVASRVDRRFLGCLHHLLHVQH